jgi:hypothetical protein
MFCQWVKLCLKSTSLSACRICASTSYILARLLKQTGLSSRQMSLQADLSGQITSPSRTSPFCKPRYLSALPCKTDTNDIGINHIKNASIPSNNIEIIHKPACLYGIRQTDLCSALRWHQQEITCNGIVYQGYLNQLEHWVWMIIHYPEAHSQMHIVTSTLCTRSFHQRNQTFKFVKLLSVRPEDVMK